ncbi:MAG: DUF1800 domain-containing protein [Firmicutes bacterium]|nr:DUF1800 domain-containing protein [Bacillota bacterium]
MADLTPITSWTLADVQHLGRRAGFGLRPEEATTWQSQSPSTVVDAWVDGAGAAFDPAAFNTALNTADVVTEPLVKANTTVAGSVDVPEVPGPHPFLTTGQQAWRNNLNTAQAFCLWRMQFNPFAFQERMALFWHNLFATGYHKVINAALMLKQYHLLRTMATAKFDDLLVAVSKDPAMCIWLDSVLNNAAGTSVPNENYAREVMELYSLGADNGYTQADITQMARALSGWSFTTADADIIVNPTNPGQKTIADGRFKVYDGSATAPDTALWYGGAKTTTPNMHATGTITLFGQTFDVTTTANGWAKGENAIRAITVARATQCSQFLAKRLLLHFVTPSAPDSDVNDVALMIRNASFDMKVVMKTLLKSRYFYQASNRFSLIEGPVSWSVRGARMLCPLLAQASSQNPQGYPAWRLVTYYGTTLDLLGMKFLDPNGPNGWKEHTAWLTSSTMRHRTKLAAALALQENAAYNNTSYRLFPGTTTDWFPTAPDSPAAVLNRLVALLQPGPLPSSVTNSWLTALWPSTFTWDAASQAKARELAFLILCSPAGQLY